MDNQLTNDLTNDLLNERQRIKKLQKDNQDEDLVAERQKIGFDLVFASYERYKYRLLVPPDDDPDKYN